MTTTLERPADSAGGLYYPTPVTPEEAFQAIGRLRKEARDEIDRLIRFLDTTDDYVSRELEDQVDDSPCDDNELDGPENGEDEDSDPAEPSLGSLNVSESSSQAFWGLSSTTDREDEHDGREPSLCGTAEMAGAQANDGDLEGGEADLEPSLGWPENRVDQARSPGNFDDREAAAEPGRNVVGAAYDRPSTHCKTDHSGRHVDIDDSMRIGQRKIRNLSPKQQKLLAPRIDRGEVRI